MRKGIERLLAYCKPRDAVEHRSVFPCPYLKAFIFRRFCFIFKKQPYEQRNYPDYRR